MKFYGIDSVNPIEIGTPSNDNSLSSLLAWDPTTGQIKYRDSSSISGGGSSSQTLSQVLSVGNNAGTYSIKFRGTQSEIYTITAGTAFYQWSATMGSILAITASAFAFKPDTTQQLSGLSVLNSILGGISYDNETNQAKVAWLCGNGQNQITKGCICVKDEVYINTSNTSTNVSSNIRVCSCTLNLYSGDGSAYTNIIFQPQNLQFAYFYGSSYSTFTMLDTGFDLRTQNLIGTNCVTIGGNSVTLNNVSGTDGQVVSINSVGQLCWQTPVAGSGGGSVVLPSGEVGFGGGDGITSSTNFIYDNSKITLKSAFNSNIDGNSYRSAILGGCINCITNNSSDSSIIGGWCNNLLSNNSLSSIIGGYCNNLNFTLEGSSIISGGYNKIQCGANYTSIIAGCYNLIECSSAYSVISGGSFNKINYASKNAVISGGNCNTIGTASCWSMIGAGCFNTIRDVSYNSTIIGGYSNEIIIQSHRNTILGGSMNKIECYTLNSTIVGGSYNKVCHYSSNSIISGGTDNKICCNSCNSVISGGNLNTIDKYSCRSSVIGGVSNAICCQSCLASIVGGESNFISYVSCQSTIIGGFTNSIYDTRRGNISGGVFISITSSNDSFVGGGFNNEMDGNNRSSIIGGSSSSITIANDSTILGGVGNKIVGSYGSRIYESTIVAGFCNSINSTTNRSLILGGSCNNLYSNSHNTSIISGCCNKTICAIRSSTIGGLCNVIDSGGNPTIYSSLILGGECNEVKSKFNGNQPCSSVVVGGKLNSIYDDSRNSIIIGGNTNKITCSCDSVIIGGSGLEINQCNCALITQSLVTSYPIGTGNASPPLLGNKLVVGCLVTPGGSYNVATSCWITANIGGTYVRLAVLQ